MLPPLLPFVITPFTAPTPPPIQPRQDWAKQLDYEEGLRRQQQEGGQQPGGAQQQGGKQGPQQDASGNKGFLSLTSRVDLNSMDVDLSQQLRARRRSGGEASTSARQPRSPAAPRRPPVKYGSVPPTRVEQRSWERSGKYSRKVVAAAPTNEADQVGALGG